MRDRRFGTVHTAGRTASGDAESRGDVAYVRDGKRNGGPGDRSRQGCGGSGRIAPAVVPGMS